MAKKILLILGTSDIQIAGNQTSKNTIRYLEKFGYIVRACSFLPDDYPNLDDPGDVFGKNVTISRMPHPLTYFFYRGRKIKNTIGKLKLHKSTVAKKKDNIAEEVEYFGDYNILAASLTSCSRFSSTSLASCSEVLSSISNSDLMYSMDMKLRELWSPA